MQVVDASEQLTRAGIDLLKSGLNKFGFGIGSSSAGNQYSTNGRRVLDDSSTLIVFVVGGITFKEVGSCRVKRVLCESDVPDQSWQCLLATMLSRRFKKCTMR